MKMILFTMEIINEIDINPDPVIILPNILPGIFIDIVAPKGTPK